MTQWRQKNHGRTRHAKSQTSRVTVQLENAEPGESVWGGGRGAGEGMGTRTIWGWRLSLGHDCGGHMPVCSPKLMGSCLGRLSYLCQLRHSLSPGAECGLGAGSR